MEQDSIDRVIAIAEYVAAGKPYIWNVMNTSRGYIYDGLEASRGKAIIIDNNNRKVVVDRSKVIDDVWRKTYGSN